MSCKSATLLVEKSKLTALSFKELVHLKLHLVLCPPCSSYNKLSRQLDELFEGMTIENYNERSLSEEKKEAILAVIEKFKK
jgi:hypothetical protein